MIYLMIRQLLSFVYPKLCSSCDEPLRFDESYICWHCLEDLPDFSTLKPDNNPAFQLFWGKSDVQYASSCFEFIKGEKLQGLIHEFKYQGRQNLAEHFGKIMAHHFLNNPYFWTIDAICYVPLTNKKEKNRGYNQARELANGIHKELNLPVLNLLHKNTQTVSQTSKNVHERHENLRNSFSPNLNPLLLKNTKHVLLVDDVMTTGATLNACAQQLINQLHLKVSVLTLAFRNV